MNFLDLLVALLLLSVVFLGVATVESHTLRLINRSSAALKSAQDTLLWNIPDIDSAKCIPTGSTPGLVLKHCTFGGAHYAKGITLLLPEP